MKLKLLSPMVTANWLFNHLSAENLIVLDASISKVGTEQEAVSNKEQLPNAIFFDLKEVFLNKNAEFPNTIPELKQFEKHVQSLGINNDSCIVVYDDLGIYSAPRAWWLFRLFGFNNVAVLDGGLPVWKQQNYPVEFFKNTTFFKGDFKASFQSDLFVNYQNVLNNCIKQEFCVVDARSADRFFAKVPEPRKELKGGHIPLSHNLPYSEVLSDHKMKSKAVLRQLFSSLNSGGKKLVFSCGSGITACILALALEVSGQPNYAVYDGSWTEWASLPNSPIEL